MTADGGYIVVDGGGAVGLVGFKAHEEQIEG
jgi:hypothetical protein